MNTMFGDWIESFRRPDEPRTRSFFRFEVEHGVSQMTIRRAVAGKPLRATTARRLAEITGLDAGALALGAAPATPAAETLVKKVA